MTSARQPDDRFPLPVLTARKRHHRPAAWPSPGWVIIASRSPYSPLGRVIIARLGGHRFPFHVITARQHGHRFPTG
jgi:hypothetical protein